ncbi:MAG: alkyl sulfatase dimerization domain-containing protein [Candidatus Helarchaeota archaeon]
MTALEVFRKEFMGLFEPISLANGKIHMIGAFGNVGIVETNDGLVMFDTALRIFKKKIFREIRAITDKPIKYLIYSHGHFDHCFGFGEFLKEIEEKGWEKPQVIAHENCIKRFKKYKLMEAHQNWINSQQFASESRGDKNLVSADYALKPTIVIYGSKEFSFDFGGFKFELYPEWGETDDALWMYIQEPAKVIFSGDLIISGYPNIGNPYKVQRYPKHWAEALEKMMLKEAEYLIPGHGVLIKGKETVRECLSITAEAMHFVHDEVVKRLNKGMWFEELFHDMLKIYPEKFKKSKWLKPMYGCYRFGIHASYRLYQGWYNSGNPTDLFPSKSTEIATELLKILGSGAEEKYYKHAEGLFKEGQLQLALHILDVIIKGVDSNNREILLKSYELKLKILKAKEKEEPSFIVKNIINNGAAQIKSKIRAIKKKLK